MNINFIFPSNHIQNTVAMSELIIQNYIPANYPLISSMTYK